MTRHRSLLALTLVGCHGCHDEHATPSTDAVPPSTAAPSSSASAAPTREAGTLEAIDRRAYAEYTQAIDRGRRATLAKSWAAAKRAFGDALRVRPHDERARAELGYAEMLAGEPDAARVNLEAARWTRDKALAAQVWFNLGLLDAAPDGGVSALAVADYWFSNELHPSDAARAKIAGRSVCPITVDDKRLKATHVTSWLGVAKVFASEPDTKCTAPATEADAKALADTPGLSAGADGAFYVVHSGTLDLTACVISVARVVQVRGADFWVYPEVGSGTFSFMLPTEPTVALSHFGRRVRVSTTESWPQEIAMCSAGDASDEVYECNGAPGEEPVGMHRDASPPDYTDFVLDPRSHELVLRIEDHASGRFAWFADGGRPIALSASADAVSVSGLGCARTFAVQ